MTIYNPSTEQSNILPRHDDTKPRPIVLHSCCITLRFSKVLHTSCTVNVDLLRKIAHLSVFGGLAQSGDDTSTVIWEGLRHPSHSLPPLRQPTATTKFFQGQRLCFRNNHQSLITIVLRVENPINPESSRERSLGAPISRRARARSVPHLVDARPCRKQTVGTEEHDSSFQKRKGEGAAKISRPPSRGNWSASVFRHGDAGCRQ